MRPIALALALIAASAATAGLGQEADRLKSPDCRRALDALEQQETKAPADRSRQDRQLDALRRQAARACLGGSGEPAPPTQPYPPPLSGLPPAPTRVPAPPPELGPPPPPPVSLPSAAKPLGVTGCDPAGCWTTDGTRLRRSGPALIGPTGPCRVHGAVLSCP